MTQNLRKSKIQKKTLCIKRKKKIKEIPAKTIKEIKNGQIIQAKKLFQTWEKQAFPKMKKSIMQYKTYSRENKERHVLRDLLSSFKNKLNRWKN